MRIIYEENRVKISQAPQGVSIDEKSATWFEREGVKANFSFELNSILSIENFSIDVLPLNNEEGAEKFFVYLFGSKKQFIKRVYHLSGQCRELKTGMFVHHSHDDTPGQDFLIERIAFLSTSEALEANILVRDLKQS